MNHIVALSGGKDSTAMALRLAEIEPQDYTYLCTPTGNELPAMETHWNTLGDLLGKPIIRVTAGTLEGLIDTFGSLPNWRQRWCTRMLKIEPCIAFLKEHQPATLYVGLRFDEPSEEREGLYGDHAAYRYPLREWEWGVEEVWGYLNEKGVCIPRRTDCAWCYDQRLVEWKKLSEQHPDLYDRAIEKEEQTGHTFRGPNKDTWPASLKELRIEFVNGRRVRGEAIYDEDKKACRVCSL